MEIIFSTQGSRMDVDRIYRFIKDSYWGKDRTLAQLRDSMANSLCFGMFTDTGEQIGFARMATDKVFFGYIMDFFVVDAYQGKGLGTRFLGWILNDPTVKNLKSIALKTKDAHGFYKKQGFRNIGESPEWMLLEKKEQTKNQ